MKKYVSIVFHSNLIKTSILSINQQQILEENISIPQKFIFEDLTIVEDGSIFPFFLLQSKENIESDDLDEDHLQGFDIFNVYQLDFLIEYANIYKNLIPISLKEVLIETEYSEEQKALIDFIFKEIFDSLTLCFQHPKKYQYDGILISYANKFPHFYPYLKHTMSEFNKNLNTSISINYVDEMDSFFTETLYHLENRQVPYPFKKRENHHHVILVDLSENHLIANDYKLTIKNNHKNQYKFYITNKSTRPKIELENIGTQRLDQLICELFKDCFEEQYKIFLNSISDQCKKLIFREILQLPELDLLKIKENVKEKSAHLKDLSYSTHITLNHHLILSDHIISTYSLEQENFMIRYSLSRILEVYQKFMIECLMEIQSKIYQQRKMDVDNLFFMASDLNLCPIALIKSNLKAEMNQNQSSENHGFDPVLIDDHLIQLEKRSDAIGTLLYDQYHLQSQFIPYKIYSDHWRDIDQKIERIQDKEKTIITQTNHSFTGAIANINLLTQIKELLPEETPEDIPEETPEDIPEEPKVLVQNNVPMSSVSILDQLIAKVMSDPLLSSDFAKHFRYIEPILNYLGHFPDLLQDMVDQPHLLVESIQPLIDNESKDPYYKLQAQVLLIDGDQLNFDQIEALVEYAKQKIGPIVQGVVIKNRWPDFVKPISGIHYRMIHLGQNSADQALIKEARRMIDEFSGDIAITIASNDSDLLSILHLDHHRQYFWIPYTQAPHQVVQTLQSYQATLLPAFQ